MADVGGPNPGRFSTRDDRAQLVIVAALVMAVVFVALAIVVNSAIYAENLATRDAGADSRDVHELRSASGLDLQRAVDRANADHPAATEPGPIWDHLRSSFDHYSRSARLEGVRHGKVVDLSLSAGTNGSHLRQLDENRNFTAGGENAGEPNWTLAADATEAGTLRLELQEDTLLDVTGESANQLLDDADDALLGGLLFHESFHVEVVTTGNGETWRVYLFQGLDASGEKKLYVYTQAPGEDLLTTEMTLEALLDDSCEAGFTGGSAVVDLRNGKVEGESCLELSFYADEVVGDSHSISYRNAATDGLSEDSAQEIVDAFDDESRLDELETALESLLGISLTGVVADDVVDAWDEAGIVGDRGTGTYDVVVNTRVDTQAESQNFYEVNGHEPTHRTIVYSATVTMAYRSGNALLETREVEIRWSEAEP